MKNETVTTIEIKGTKPGSEEYVWVNKIATTAGREKFAVFMRDEAGEPCQIERYDTHARAVECAAVWAINRTAYLCGCDK